MAPVTTNVPPEVVYCRGRACHSFADCAVDGSCKYKSSSDEYRDRQPPVLDTIEKCPKVTVEDCTRLLKRAYPQETLDESIGAGVILTPPIQDFTGTIDGAGVKGSMTDATKPPLSLIDPTFILGLGAVLGFGAKKYAAGNWLRGMKWSEVMNGIKRHIASIEMGEMLDSDSGLPHVYHASCGIMFLARFTTDPSYKQFDDRLFAKAGV